jgi:subtilisin family serine protease
VRVYQFRHIRALQPIQCATGPSATADGALRTMFVLKRVFLLVSAASLAALLLALAGSAAPGRAMPVFVEAIVLVDERTPDVEERIRTAIPAVRFRWRYSVVLDGVTVVVPRGTLETLRRVPGVEDVYPSVPYRPTLYSSPGFIGAPALWGAGLESAGNGIKIGIIDDGVDRSHPFFSAAGYRPPAGYPKGQRAHTTAKVIVARAFAPRSPRWRYARRPFDPVLSAHATHVAGIAAGNNRTSTGAGRVSGVAPRAYIGNYKVLTIPTVGGFGLNGNSPEIVAGIEAAVRDGMNVINLSIGEAEIEPGRDLVARALDGAAAAGVIPVVAAGNDYIELGNGSLTSPGSSERAITVAAESISGPTIASFSSGGPTPLSLRMKPDLTAPGVGVVSSVPRREGLWTQFSGTSMAAPHIAGAAALLRQRHPTWTVNQVKSALVLTGNPVYRSASERLEALSTRQGGGSANLPEADAPLLFAEPSSLSFGLVSAGGSAARPLAPADAGGGAGAWTVAVVAQTAPAGAAVVAPPAVAVPGELVVTASGGGAQGEAMGHVVLTRGGERRRIPYWFRVTAPALGRHRPVLLRRTGTYRGNTRGRPALVDTYRYPDNPLELRIPRTLRGPEQVFRIRLTRPAANFGVAITSRRGRVEPRLVRAGDENRLLGSVALPFNANPYTRRFQAPEPVSGATKPAAGDYDFVFDSATPRGAGSFTFRFWINDATRPRLRLVTPAARRGGRLLISAVDRGSGVNPRAIRIAVAGRLRPARWDARRRLIIVSLRGVGRGRKAVHAEVADYQESKNQENVARILPNTARLRTSVVIR